jgi:hypothetical protein
VSASDLDRRWQELDASIKASGDARGLSGQIADQRLDAREFREYLHVGMLHERLARRALDLPPEAPVTGAQQEVWLDQQMQERGLETFAPPWSDGVLARCGGETVRAEDFGRVLRRRLDPQDVRETCWHILLCRGIERRMPDLSAEARERAVDLEIERRRAKYEQENAGISFEQYLAAQGRNAGVLRHDPSVLIAALARLWVDQTAGSDGLRETYERERSTFEGLHGRTVRTHMLFLVASRRKNQLNPRTFEEAEAELLRLTDEVGDVADFAALCARRSEEPNTRAAQGDLGWLARADPRWPAALREAIFVELDSGLEVPPEGVRLGPVRLDTGSAVLWISALRESPSWEVMSEHVHEELRRRFLRSVLLDTEVELVE